jgi:hypothetical protein
MWDTIDMGSGVDWSRLDISFSCIFLCKGDANGERQTQSGYWRVIAFFYPCHPEQGQYALLRAFCEPLSRQWSSHLPLATKSRKR